MIQKALWALPLATQHISVVRRAQTLIPPSGGRDRIGRSRFHLVSERIQQLQTPLELELIYALADGPHGLCELGVGHLLAQCQKRTRISSTTPRRNQGALSLKKTKRERYEHGEGYRYGPHVPPSVERKPDGEPARTIASGTQENHLILINSLPQPEPAIVSRHSGGDATAPTGTPAAGGLRADW